MNKSNDRSNNEVEKFFCDNCEERIVFNLKQGDKYFHLPLSKMLECLLIAEAEGEVPMIDDDWWSSLESLYPNIEKMRKELQDY